LFKYVAKLEKIPYHFLLLFITIYFSQYFYIEIISRNIFEEYI